MNKFINKLIKKTVALFLSFVFVLGSSSNLNLIWGATEEPFYVDFYVDCLAYTEQYLAAVYALNTQYYNDTYKLINDFTEFFVNIDPNEEIDPEVIAESPNVTGEQFQGQLIDTSVGNNGLIYKYTTDYLKDSPYFYGKNDLWENFQPSDVENKTRYMLPNGISQQTNDENFKGVPLPYARTGAVGLWMSEAGVAYYENNAPDTLRIASNPYDGWYYFIVLPDETPGGGTTSNIRTEYKRKRGPMPEPKPFPEGTLPYTCLDPVDAVSGAFTWSYPDLKIGGKHQMAFTRMYDGLEGTTGIFGKNWKNSHNYTLEVDSTNAYFTLPDGEGIPFKYDKASAKFLPSSILQQNYTLSYSGSSRVAPEQNIQDEEIQNSENVTQNNEESLNNSSGRTVIRGFVKPASKGAKAGRTTDNDGKTKVVFENKNGASYENTFEIIKPQSTNTNNSARQVSPAAAATGFDPAGKAFTIRSRDGTTYYYNSNLQLVKIEESGVLKYNYEYNAENKLSKITGKNNAFFELTYNGDKVSKVTDYAGNYATYDYDGDNLVKSTNSEGDSITYSYDANSNIVAITNFSGNVYLTNKFDDKNRVTEQFVEDKGTSFASYDDAKKANTFTDEKGNKTTFYYDDSMTVTKIKSPAGEINNVFNPSAQVLEQTNELGQKTTFGYDAKGRQNKITYPDGTSKQVTYNNNNMVTLEQYSDGTKTEYTYDSNNNLTSLKDTLGNTEHYTYDNSDNMLSYKNKLGQVTSYTYDGNGFISTETNALGQTTRYTYDKVGRLIKATTPMGREKSFSYSPTGKLLSETDSDGTITYAKDKNGLNTAITNKLGYSRTFEYNTLGQVTKETDFEQNPTTYAYDERGYLVKTTDPLNFSQTSSYDASGNLSSQKDKNGHVSKFEYDSANRLVKKTDALGGTNSYTYDNMGRISIETDAINATTKYEYDTMGRIKKQTDALSNAVTYEYDAKGRLKTKIEKNSKTTNYEYDVLDRVIKISSNDGSLSTFVYDALGRVVSSSDAHGNQEETSFDSDGSKSLEKDKEGNVTKYEYDASGRVSKVINPDGTFSQNFYDKNGNITKTIDPTGAFYEYTYDKNGRSTLVKNPLGYLTKTEYNARGEVVSRTDESGNKTTFEYDANGNKTKETDPLSGVKTFEYDALNRLVAEKDQLGNVTKYAYDANSNITTETDPKGNVKTYKYDLLNRKTEVKNALNNVYKMEYDSEGNLVKTTDEEGFSTFYNYDLAGRLVEVKDALGNSTKTKYDALGQMVEVTNEKGATLKKEYTKNGNVSKITNPDGTTKTYTYNNMGRVLTQTDEKGAKTEYEYNLAGAVSKKTMPNGAVSQFTYDQLGRIKTVKDPKGAISSYTYDATGNVVASTDANGITTAYEYDANNNMTKFIVNSGQNAQTTIFKYNKASQTIEEVNPSGKVKTYTHDANGNVVKVKDEEAKVTENTYDQDNNLVKVAFADGKTASYTYNKKGELIKFTDSLGVTSKTLDPLGRLKEVNDHNNRKTSYEYDATGNKTAVTYPNGEKTSYSYDVMNRLVSVKDSDGQTTTYEHDVLGNVTKQENPNGETTDYTYDIMGQKTSSIERLGDVVTRENRYEYDLLGNVTKEMQKADYAPLNKTKTYVYDSTSQLLKATENGSTSEYSYDNFGNLAKEVVSGREIIYNYNNLNQLVGKTAESDSYSYSYDQRGNLVSETKNGAVVKTYAYNAENKMIKGENKMIKGENKETGEASEYEYNALGYRTALTQKKKNGNASFVNNLNSFGNNYSEFLQEIAKKDSDIEQKTFEDVLGLTRQLLLPTVKTEFVADYTSYAKADLVAYENGSYTTTYTYGENDEKISQSVSHHVGLTDVLDGKNPLTQIATTNIKKAYYHKTRQGSTAYVTDKDGQVLAFTEYDAWGKMETQKPSTMNFAGLDDITDYTGHAYDEVLEKYFAQARFYDAVNRRFITEDPARYGLNWYSYVSNNPANAIDPTGLYYVVMYYDEDKKEFRDKVIPESHFLALTRSASNFVPELGTATYDIIKKSSQTNVFGVIGGNSMSDYNFEKFLDDMDESFEIKDIDEALRRLIGFSPVGCTISTVSAISEESLTIAKMDDLVISLFEFYNLRNEYKLDIMDSFPSNVKFNNPLNPYNTVSVQHLVNRMESSYNFISNNSSYYLAEIFDTKDTLFEIDMKLSKASDKQRRTMIKKYVDILRYQLSDAKTPIGRDKFGSSQIKEYEIQFESFLWAFKSRTEYLKEAFRNELTPPSVFSSQR